jgi:2-oxo-4-hydroxy-4-carboxy-5-ureidoimidazoline decarboxylase
MESWLALDLASAEDARRMLQRCCASTRWVERMLARRPFATRERLLDAAAQEWRVLQPADWVEAFSAHPRIGDREALRRRFAATRDLSEREQAAMNAVSEDVLAAFEEANAAYEARFHYLFIICATGRSAEEMLAALRARLRNDPADEILVAAEEQEKITEVRLLGL